MTRGLGSRDWWWWHSARVISDRNLNGVHSEVIDEFPQFSFLLADNHPHVLALPFVVLALGLALNIAADAAATEPLRDRVLRRCASAG